MQSIESSCQVENEAEPMGDAPTTSEGSTDVFPTKMQLILEVWW